MPTAKVAGAARAEPHLAERLCLDAGGHVMAGR